MSPILLYRESLKFELYCLSEPVDVVFVGSSQLIAEMFLYLFAQLA
jgi:hypothetical protein